MSETRVKFLLAEQDIPTHWVNLMADLPGNGPPPLHPGTGQPIGPQDLAPLLRARLPIGAVLGKIEQLIPPDLTVARITVSW